MNPRRLLLSVASVLVAASIVAPQPLAAAPGQAATSWGVVPAQREGEPPRPAFLLDLVPGVDVEDTALIVNEGDEPLAVDVYAADGQNLEDGSFALESSDEPKDLMGAWIELPFTAAVVQPGKALPVPFTIHVPADVEIGDHSGGIVAIDAEASAVEQEEGAALGVKQGVGVRVHGRVAGPSQPGIEVLDVSVDTEQSVAGLFGAPSTATVTYTLRNSGNLRISPTVQVEVGGIGPSATAPEREVVDFLPGSTATITEKVSGVWPTGLVTATVTATALDQTDSASSRALVVPWLLIAIVVAGLAGFFVRRRRRRRATMPPTDGGASSRIPVGAQLVVLIAIAAALVGAMGVRSAGAAEPPTIQLSTTKAAPGDVVGISGRNWPANELVQVVVCGNQAVDGSADCNEQGYTMRLADQDGAFSAGMTIFEPPAPCPCVLKASSLSAGSVLTPIELTGVPFQTPASKSPLATPQAGGLVVVDVEVVRGSGLASIFGAAADATLKATVTNTSDRPIEAAAVARWGKGSTPTNSVPSIPAQVFEPGETITLEMPFELSPFAVGGYRVAGELRYGDETTTLSAKTSQWPWGLAIIALVVVQLVLLGLRNRARRRLARSHPPLHFAGDLPPSPAEEFPPEEVPALVPVGGLVIDLDASSDEDTASMPIDLDAPADQGEQVDLDAPADVVVVPTRRIDLVPQVPGPVVALRTVQLAAHLRESTRASLAERDLTPEEVDRRLQRSERARRELAESLVLASAYRSDDMLDQRWCVPPPASSVPAPLALSPARDAVSV